MAIPILMPALSPTMKEGNLAKWLKKEGEKVKPGDVIAEIETDKATMEVESADGGLLGKIVINEQTDGVQVNKLIAVLLEPGEKAEDAEKFIASYAQEADSTNQEKSEPKTEKTAPTQPEAKRETPQNTKNERIFASPLAKRIASNNNIDLSKVTGTGPKGRIIKADVEGHSSSSSTSIQSFGRNATEGELKPVSIMRKVIAERLTESKQNVPHFYLSVDCNISNLLKIREQINSQAFKNADGKPEYKISINDFVIKASAHGLLKNPETNCSWTDDGILQYNNIDIATAVAIPDGLITPIVKNADQKSLSTISNEMKELVKRAKSGSLKPEEFQGGSFSVSNLGMFGIRNFNAIINPPQSCIISVGANEKKPFYDDKDQLQMGQFINLTLSCDHRVVDGAAAANLLNCIKDCLENPTLMLV